MTRYDPITSDLRVLEKEQTQSNCQRTEMAVVAGAAIRSGIAVCHVLDNLRSGVGVTQVVHDLMTFGDMASTGIIVHDTGVSPMFDALMKDGRLSAATSIWDVAKALLAERRRGTCLLHVHSRRNVWICIFAKIIGYRVVRSQHFGSVEDPKRMLRTSLRNFLTLRTFWVDRWIAVSETSRDYIRHRWQIPLDRITVIPNGVDTSRFAPQSLAERSALRAQLNIDDMATVFASLGALVERKRHGTVLEAFARATKDQPEARLLIVGEGSQRATLELAVAELELDGRVMLLGLRHDVPDLLGACDALVHGALDEAFGLAVAEALACGIPAIVFDGKGPAEIVKHLQTGLVVNKSEENSLTEAMSVFLQEPTILRQLGQAGRDYVATYLSKSGMLKRYVELYRHELEPQRVQN